jgi:WD40 repeat protein
MRIRLTYALVLWTAAAVAAQDGPPLPQGAVQRLGDTRFRTGARITCLAFSPDGTRLASWGNWMYFEDRLSVWDTATGGEVFTRSMPEHQLAGLGWGPPGGFAVLTNNGSSRVWGFADASGKYPPTEPVPTPKGPAIGIVGIGPREAPSPERLALSPDGTRLAMVRPGGSVQLFAIKAGAAVTDLKSLATSGATPGGTCAGLYVVRGGKAVVVLTDTGKEQSAVLWDVEKGTMSEPVAVPVGVRQGTRQSLDVAEDGSALAVGLENGAIHVFDLPSGKERLSVRKHDGPSHGGKWSEVSAVKFVNGGRQVLSAGRDNQQLVWDAKTGADVAVLNGHKSWVEAVAVSADGKRVATAGQDSLVRLWDATTWKPILPPEGPYETVWRLEASRDGRYVAAGSGSGAYVWELATGKEVRVAPSAHRVGYVLFAPDGALLAGDGKEGLSLYPFPAGEPKPLAIKGRLLAFTPDGKTLLTADGSSVTLWDWPAGTRRQSISLPGEAQSAVVSPDGRMAVVGVSGRTAAVLNLASGAVRELPAKLHWFDHAAGFAPGGRVVCGTVGTPSAEAWVLGTGGRVRQFEQPRAKGPGHFYQLSLAVSPDGRKTATCQSDGGIAVYETATGQLLAQFHGHRDSAISVAWAGSDRVLSAGSDHQVLVWDASLRTLAGKVDALPATERTKVWDRLVTPKVKEAIPMMAALAADPDRAVAMLSEHMKPIATTDPAVLDRIFNDLDAKGFAAREKASRELSGLGVGAVAGVRERAAKAVSEEVRGRVDAFLRQFAGDDLTPDRVRYLRTLEVLAAADTPATRRLIEGLAGGAADIFETEAARQALRALPARPVPK